MITLKKYDNDFYIQSAINPEDFRVGLTVYAKAKEKKTKEEKIKLCFAAATHYHCFFAIRFLCDEFNRLIKEKDKPILLLKNLLFWCYNDQPPIQKENLAELSKHFIVTLCLNLFRSGTPGFLQASYAYGYLAEFFQLLHASEQLSKTEAIYLISDAYENAVRYLIAAKLVRSHSEAEMRNAFKHNSDMYEKYSKESDINKLIIYSYEHYYVNFIERHGDKNQVLELKTLENQAQTIADMFLNLTSEKAANQHSVVNNSIFNKPANETIENVASTKSSENQLSL